jgi:hypothetical protein
MRHSSLGVRIFGSALPKLVESIVAITTSVGRALAQAVTKVFLRSVGRLLVAASVVPSSPILVTLMKEVLSSSETSVLTRAIRRNNPEDVILNAYSSRQIILAASRWSS